MSGLSKSTEAGIFGGLKGAGDLLTRNARVAGRRVGLVFEETRLSWLEVNARSCRFAHELRKSGIERGDRVGIYAGNSHQWVEAAFALAKLGAVLVTVNNRLAPLEVRYILNDAAVKALIVGKAELPNAKLATEDTPNLKLMIGIDSDEPGLENYEAMVSCGADDEPALDHPLQYDDPLMLLYTSGTTGFPKGAIYTHGSMLIGAMYHVHAIGARSTHRVMLPSPMYSAAGIAGIYAHTYVGAHCVILDFDPDKVLHTLARERITFTNLVPTTIQRLIHRDDLGEFDLSHLETILYGGSPISLRVLREAKRKLPHVGFRQTFASTETGLKGTVLEPAEHELALSDPTWEHLLMSCGRPQTNIQVAVWDEEGNEVPTGSIGEIAIRSEANIAGFWNNAVATSEAIVNGWVLTGDVARMDEDGYFYLIDRKKDLIVTGAFNVYPSEVERVLQKHPAVHEVAVIGVPSEQWGEAIKACVVLAPDMSASEQEIIAFCDGSIAGYKKPKSVDFVASLPRNATGKVLYRQLRETYWKDSERTIG